MENPYGSQKIVHHPDKLEALKDRKITSPVYVRIKPTNKCRHHCSFDNRNIFIKDLLEGKVDPLIIIREMQTSPRHVNFI